MERLYFFIIRMAGGTIPYYGDGGGRWHRGSIIWIVVCFVLWQGVVIAHRIKFYFFIFTCRFYVVIYWNCVVLQEKRGDFVGYQKRLDHAFCHVPTLPICPERKYVLFSDCHRGNGTNNDNFLKNQHLYIAALRHCPVCLETTGAAYFSKMVYGCQNQWQSVCWASSLVVCKW